MADFNYIINYINLSSLIYHIKNKDCYNELKRKYM